MAGTRWAKLVWVFSTLVVFGNGDRSSQGEAKELRAGAARVDVSPVQFPVNVNGGMTSRTATEITTKVHARALVLSSDEERVGIVVVDSCMMSREFLDEVKQLAATKTLLRPDRILISATHTHTAPASMSCLGTDADPTYVPYLRLKIVEALVEAEKRLQPAEVGFSKIDASPFTALRRWVRRPDRLAKDPFGNLTVRANMHAGQNWDDVTGESGPEDPDLSLLSVRSIRGEPIALLTNFSMHYFSGDQAISSDYFGRYCDVLQNEIGGQQHPGFVAMMSHGCSGDIWRKDYTREKPSAVEELSIQAYAEQLARLALQAHASVTYEQQPILAMAEERLPMQYRTPNRQTLEWAQRIVNEMGDRLPKTQEEIYAREQVLLHEKQVTEVVVQALRIGETGIATTPTETYALTGLKIKKMSPTRNTIVLDLANGGDGYIPPPEQHGLGGYNTWPARSAGLEISAEPRIVESAVKLLETVTGQPRLAYLQESGAGVDALKQLEPLAYFRLDEWGGPRAKDHSGQERDAIIEDGVLFFLEGPLSKYFSGEKELNRSLHFAGGRLQTRFPKLRGDYSISCWVWNGMPTDARDVTGWIWSRGHDHATDARGEHLGIGGTKTDPGKIILQIGSHQTEVGESEIPRWTWVHVLFVRQGDRVQVYVNGNQEPEIDTLAPLTVNDEIGQFFFGGKCDSSFNFEGRLDEVAIFNRALKPQEIRRLDPQDQ
jgi:hypothetical protein